MVVEKRATDEEKMERRCIMVGVDINGDGRELLNWAVINFAEEGDRVTAVNVSRIQDSSRASTPSLIKLLDDCFSEQEDLCTRKKVILAGRVCQGNSIKKVLVKEAELCLAKALIVGENKNHSFGGVSSLAKYCAKRLPQNIALIAIHKGQIVLERKPVSETKCRFFLHPGVVMHNKAVAPISRFAEIKDAKHIAEEPKDYCFVVHDRKRESSRCSLPLLERKLSEPKPGWPLLHRAVTANVEPLKEIEARKMSVVQWVMTLPDRCLAANQRQVNLVKELEIILEINSSSCKFFRYEELQNFTNCFSQENLIGEGGNSQVYKGFLPDGQQLAIKGNYIISVYPYFSCGSLDDNLHGKKPKTPLDWDNRFKIAVGVAGALSYIHDGCSLPVVHRDVKSSNILLSDESKPQLCDFGLAIWEPTGSQYLKDSDLVGTFGYLAPEYFMYGKVSRKIDVYAFGVVLLELLSGRKPIDDESSKGQESLVMWATPLLDKWKIMDLLDPNLEGKCDDEQMKRMMLAASLCIRRAAHRRPQMSQILSLLQGEEDLGPWMSSTNKNSNPNETDCQDEEAYHASSIGSHISLALLDVDDDASVMSFEQNYISSSNEYLQDRWSRSSSFD
ncbi:hypothetical protein HPP92_014536 [Vanilla planifolia]|uniref:Protein kinase domain-containing protein n=1 Tax=Vanilla planifolia TaxID=51239 RepID=A0A835QMW7_VANPL|nr:hypothetical protein HPP92_014536 [Vanilla planifolia]